MAVYVLVHGGGHGGWCWRDVAVRLRAAGHEVYTPTLTGLGERRHLLNAEVDLGLHVDDVVNMLVFEDLHDVILVGHSYSGMVIPGVADRAIDRVGQLVYLDAARPNDGEALVDLNPAATEAMRGAGRVVDGVELVLLPEGDPLGNYGVTDEASLSWMRPRLTPHPWRCFTQPLRLADPGAVERLPRTCINATSTLRVRDAEGVARALDADHVWEIDSGHDLMITAPAEVAELLLRLA